MALRWTIFLFSCVLLFSAGGVITASAASTDTRYVSDQLVITVREGMGTQYKVIKTLKTDTSMEVLSAQKKYLYVRLDDGTQGYVLKQYVTKKTPRSWAIKQLHAQVQTLTIDLAKQAKLATSAAHEVLNLREQLAQATQALALNAEALETTKAELSDLQMKAENVVLIDTERQNLKKELGVANGELAQLRQDNTAMLKTAMIKWFVAGGGVLFFGWLAGKFSRKKKRNF